MAVTIADEKIKSTTEELNQANEELEKIKRAQCLLVKENRQLLLDINQLQQELGREKQHADRLEEVRLLKVIVIIAQVLYLHTGFIDIARPFE